GILGDLSHSPPTCLQQHHFQIHSVSANPPPRTMYATAFLATAAVIALTGVEATSEAYFADCKTYTDNATGEIKCITAYDTLESVQDCQMIMWDGDTALCFDSCAHAEYDGNGKPLCLAKEGACMVTWNGPTPFCLTDVCGAPVDSCADDRIGYCHPGGDTSITDGIYCFAACAPDCILYSDTGMPQCADATSPCSGGTPLTSCPAAGLVGGLGASFAPTAAPAATPSAAPSVAPSVTPSSAPTAAPSA
ncbi:hypothetical protein JKP88DRAFT_313749, partial [Tribonema minus]